MRTRFVLLGGDPRWREFAGRLGFRPRTAQLSARQEAVEMDEQHMGIPCSVSGDIWCLKLDPLEDRVETGVATVST